MAMGIMPTMGEYGYGYILIPERKILGIWVWVQFRCKCLISDVELQGFKIKAQVS